MGLKDVLKTRDRGAQFWMILGPARGELPADPVFDPMQAGRIEPAGAEPVVEECDRPSADDGERSAEMLLQAGEDRRQRRIDRDGIRLFGDLGEGAVEIEEERDAPAGKRRLVKFLHRLSHGRTHSS